MKKILYFIAASFGMMLLLNGIIMLFFTNVNVGNFACMFFGIVFVACGLCRGNPDKMCDNKFFRALFNLIVAGSIFAVAFSFFLDMYGKTDTTDYKEDVLIVLGAGGRGEAVTNPLAYRLNEAVEYLEKNKKAIVIVSGGQGNGESISEAEAMRRYLENSGIDPDRILKEDKSTSTYENFRFSKAIADERFGSQYDAVFVTNDFHVFRAERIGAQAGLSLNRMGAPLDWYVFWPCTLREGLAVAKHFVFGN